MHLINNALHNNNNDEFFEQIASDLQQQGYSIQPNGLPIELTEGLYQQVHSLSEASFSQAGIGRQQDSQLNSFVRRDSIRWIEGATPPEKQWLEWSKDLQQYLNRRLFLGLFSFESHFAHYQPGDFYKKHLDAFKGESNRILTVVTYLNPGWLPEDNGELLIYSDQDHNQPMLKVTPAFGTVVIFLSEDFPHEVLAANRDRYSIAGWYRLNTSINGQIDPPR